MIPGAIYSANVSKDGKYRYHLGRVWPTKSTSGINAVCWIMLNPSTADAYTDDATINKCIKFSNAWGHNGMVVANLFALRSTNPFELVKKPREEIVGPLNDDFILSSISKPNLGLNKISNGDGTMRDSLIQTPINVTRVVCAWGNSYTKYLGWRAKDVLEMLDDCWPVGLMCLGVTKCNYPRHPLYMPDSTLLQRYNWKELLERN